MSDVDNEFRPPYDIVSFELDPVDGMVSVTYVDDARASRQNGVLPEVRVVRLDGQRWAEHVQEVFVSITDLLIAVEESSTPMTRPGRG